MKTVLERFEEKIERIPFCDCWIWSSSVNADGYGTFFNNRKARRAHRISWEVYRGIIPKGKQVLHRCDNPPCVNPDHLFLGTVLDNMNDSIKKDRRKLNSERVNDIRSGNLSASDAAKKYDIDKSHFYSVRNFRVWKDQNGR